MDYGDSVDRPVPNRLNLLIVCVVATTACALLWLGSRAEFGWALLLGIAFSFLMLTNYALIHEASHGVLNSNSRINQLLGTVTGWFFLTSFTVLRVTHIVHHCCNRTDYEMFDYYYQGDNRLLKYIQWYGLMFGLWWPLIPVGNLLIALMPWLLHSPPFKQARSTAVLFDDFGQSDIWRIRFELAGGILFWLGLYHLLALNWQTLLIFYLCFSFNWSTRQYVTHAFTRRSVRDGALNLRVSRPMGWLLLNGHWDLVHHHHPHVPWLYLSELGRNSETPISYWRQYARLWRGPRPSPEPGPSMLAKQSYQGM
jgi:fatty acid desaturase